MAQEGPKMAPTGLQKGPQEGSKRDIGPNLAQRPLQEPPGTLPDPSGERFGHQLGPQNGPREGKIVHREPDLVLILIRTLIIRTIPLIIIVIVAATPSGGARCTGSGRKLNLLSVTLLRWHGGGICRRQLDSMA